MAFTIDLKEKVVLVTGVSSGIGLGVAREFARVSASRRILARIMALISCGVRSLPSMCTR